MGTLCVAAFFEKNRLITPIWIVLKIGEIKARGAQKAEATSVAEHFFVRLQRRDRQFGAQSNWLWGFWRQVLMPRLSR